ncbi:MAG: toll/interleukin-1 receptor domain-containing protein [Chloroflexi bacterium]|nr:toll/interleukin-1 receptor domain-containing protein [Chloroflexota bacterium]
MDSPSAGPVAPYRILGLHFRRVQHKETPPKWRPLRAYISYAPANLIFVERIAADLSARSIQAVVDRGLMPTRGGTPTGWESIRAIVERSDVLLLIASPEAIASADVMREIEFAVEQRKLIIPLKLRMVSLPKPIDTIQWFDFEEGRYDRDLKYLLLNLAFVTPGSPATFDPTAGIAKLPEPPTASTRCSSRPPAPKRAAPPKTVSAPPRSTPASSNAIRVSKMGWSSPSWTT